MTISANRILDCALSLATEQSWATLSLRQLSNELNCSLAVISHYYRSKDDLAEALFDRADQHMLTQSIQADDEAERLCQYILSWFEYLSPYKALVKAMLGYKFEPGHIHLQAHGITRISRTVQWFLTASDCRSVGLQRIALEVAVTTAYLDSFRYFLWDGSEQHQRTRQYLRHRLALAYRLTDLLRHH